MFGPFLLALVAGCGGRAGSPYSPAQALQSFEIEEGFVVELVAAEPLVMDPVAMEIYEYGRVYVVEMPGYPLDTGGSGRVKMLRDTDGDGKPDKATLFAAGLRLPTGVMRWKCGILVTDPPDVWYLEDSDGDHRADVRQRVLTGFALSNPQHNANRPLYGLDNWIYVANNGTISWTEKYADPFGDRGDEIHFPAKPDGPRLPPNGADRNVRFRPDTFELETLSGKSQFGQTFDAWGRHFLNDNSHHHYYEVLAARYFERNPAIAVGRATQSTSDHGDASEVYPITLRPEHQLLTDRGVFTSACGITYYLGGLFPPPYDGGVTFTAEPVHNVVHADRVASSGPGFTASRLTEGREFLASTDSWFRPVNFTIGPDGALYLVDYYRQIVEHPEWMDDAVVASGQLQRGRNRGRIYRIVPRGTPSMQWLEALDPGRASELVPRLADSNVWWRMTAQRLLVEARDPSATPRLTTLLRKSDRPEGRLHALWTLDGLTLLEQGHVRTALMDPHPGVRENAIRMAEKHLHRWPDLAPNLVALHEDPVTRVRFQALNTLGDLPYADAREAQQRILERDMDHEWVQAAALLSMRMPDLLETALKHPQHPGFVERISEAVAQGTGHGPLLERIMSTPAGRWWHAPALRGMARGTGNAALAPSERDALLEHAWTATDTVIAQAALDLLQHTALPPDVVAKAAAAAADPTASHDRRMRAVRILATGAAEAGVLLPFLAPNEPLDLQLEVLRGLRQSGGTTAARTVLDRWPSLTPRVRQAALGIFVSPDRAALLVEALEQGSAPS